MHTVYIALGSNLGNRRGVMREALIQLSERVGEVV